MATNRNSVLALASVEQTSNIVHQWIDLLLHEREIRDSQRTRFLRLLGVCVMSLRTTERLEVYSCGSQKTSDYIDNENGVYGKCKATKLGLWSNITISNCSP